MSDEAVGVTDLGREQAGSWLAAILGSAEEAIVAKDLRGIVTSWNRAAERIFGYSAEEIVGSPITTIIPPDRLDEEQDILRRVSEGEDRIELQTERRRKDDRLIPVSLTITPIRDEAGQIVGISKIARDLSETHRMSTELQRSEAVLRSILQTVPDALIVADEHGIIQSFSPAAERMFGYGAAEMIGQNVSILMPSPYREAHDGYIDRYLGTGERRIIGTRRIVVGRRKGGATFPSELAVGEVNESGQRLFTGFHRDLTERQDRERRLAELQAELVHVSRLNDLGQMVSALAHEVNQPLAAMSNYASGVRRLLAGGKAELALAAMDRVLDQAERARQIVQRLRDLVRKGETEKRVENLARTIEEASALALVGIGERIHLDIRVEDDAGFVVIDKVQIQQILINLIRNAAEAMAGQPDRKLSITAVRQGDQVAVSVADSGPGLSQDVRAKLFQPFVTTKPQGMGVGLSVCRTIAEAHGGQLWAEDPPSGGAVFRFTVPWAEPVAAPRPR